MCPTVSMTGRKLRQFNIVSSMTIANELSRYNLPGSAYARVTTSQRGFMVGELFTEYLNKVLVPGIQGLRKELGKEKKTAGLLMHGMTAHDSPRCGPFWPDAISARYFCFLMHLICSNHWIVSYSASSSEDEHSTLTKPSRISRGGDYLRRWTRSTEIQDSKILVPDGSAPDFTKRRPVACKLISNM